MTTKEAIYGLSSIANENSWSDIIMYANQRLAFGDPLYYMDQDYEDCPASNPVKQFVNNPCVTTYGVGADVPAAIIQAVEGQGLELRPQCFWATNNPETGWSGYTYSLIRADGVDITLAEMWVSEMREAVTTLGYEVRAYSQPGHFPWGVWGSTKDEAYQQLLALISIMPGGFTRFEYPGGGYIWLPKWLPLLTIYRVMTASLCSPLGAVEVLEFCPDGTTPKKWRTCTAQGWENDEDECPTCVCGSWADSDCISPTERLRIRSCTPQGCDIEQIVVSDESCADQKPSKLPALISMGAIAVGAISLL